MINATSSAGVFVFELIRYVDGEAVPYAPYSGGCTSCCGQERVEQPRSCCSR